MYAACAPPLDATAAVPWADTPWESDLAALPWEVADVLFSAGAPVRFRACASLCGSANLQQHWQRACAAPRTLTPAV
jgi:hypothetical protein